MSHTTPHHVDASSHVLHVCSPLAASLCNVPDGIALTMPLQAAHIVAHTRHADSCHHHAHLNQITKHTRSTRPFPQPPLSVGAGGCVS
jgi:hypothetical protein